MPERACRIPPRVLPPVRGRPQACWCARGFAVRIQQLAVWPRRQNPWHSPLPGSPGGCRPPSIRLPPGSEATPRASRRLLRIHAPAASRATVAIARRCRLPAPATQPTRGPSASAAASVGAGAPERRQPLHVRQRGYVRPTPASAHHAARGARGVARARAPRVSEMAGLAESFG
jgi:hypothetical protein